MATIVVPLLAATWIGAGSSHRGSFSPPYTTRKDWSRKFTSSAPALCIAICTVTLASLTSLCMDVTGKEPLKRLVYSPCCSQRSVPSSTLDLLASVSRNRKRPQLVSRYSRSSRPVPWFTLWRVPSVALIKDPTLECTSALTCWSQWEETFAALSSSSVTWKYLKSSHLCLLSRPRSP